VLLAPALPPPAAETCTNTIQHDAVLDYYGRRLATCSSDALIQIFEVEGDSHKLTETLRGPHDSAIFSLTWAHPKHGTILASSSYTGRVALHREQPAGTWTQIGDFALHSASVNSVSWAPHDAGCVLACASSDGNVSVLEFKDTGAVGGSIAPEQAMIRAHELGCNAISWGPALAPGALASASSAAMQQQGPLRRFVTGGSDCLVSLWTNSAPGQYTLLTSLSGHTDWVRDVAWSPSVLAKTYIASASQDKTVRIWALASGQDASVADNWKCTVLNFECVVWRVSWNLSGNVLAVSGGDNRISLWKEKVRDGGWESVKTLEE
jgi:protein transport protein SEC13